MQSSHASSCFIEEFQELDQDDQPSLGRNVDVLFKAPSFNLVGVINDIRPHALSVLVKQPLAERSAVSIEFGAVSHDAEVISCRRKGSRFEACVVLPNRKERDLRTAERFPITEEVQIGVGNSDSVLDAMVTNLSARGIGLETPTILEKGEFVTVESVSNLAFGIVRYCRPLDDGRFQTGVEVFHVMPKEAGASV